MKVRELFRATSDDDLAAAIEATEPSAGPRLGLYRAARSEILALAADPPAADPHDVPRGFSPPGLPGVVVAVRNAFDQPGDPPSCLIEFRVPHRAPEGAPEKLHAFGLKDGERFWLHMVPWRRMATMELAFGRGSREVPQAEIAALLLREMTRHGFTARDVDAALSGLERRMVESMRSMGLFHGGETLN